MCSLNVKADAELINSTTTNCWTQTHRTPNVWTGILWFHWRGRRRRMRLKREMCRLAPTFVIRRPQKKITLHILQSTRMRTLRASKQICWRKHVFNGLYKLFMLPTCKDRIHFRYFALANLRIWFWAVIFKGIINAHKVRCKGTTLTVCCRSIWNKMGIRGIFIAQLLIDSINSMADTTSIKYSSFAFSVHFGHGIFPLSNQCSINRRNYCIQICFIIYFTLNSQ